MTLSRKIILRNSALIVGLLLLAIASLVGLSLLRLDVRVALDEYKDSQAIEKIKLRMATAHFASEPTDVPAAVDALQAAARDLIDFDRAQNPGEGDEPADYDLTEREQAQAARKHVLAAADALRGAQPDASAANHEINEAVNQLSLLAKQMDQTVKLTQNSARRGVQRTMVFIGIVTALIACAAVVISINQYRSVIVPLQKLREGVGAVAAGHRDVATANDPEYQAIADDFNRMAAELDSFYRDLEQKVAVKSKQLALSERLASVGFLAAGVAHEINNPLSIISGYAELSIKRLKRDQTDGQTRALHDEVIRTLAVIRDEAFRCKEITSKLLALARGGGDRRAVLSLPHMASDVVELIGGLNKYADRNLLLRFPQDENLEVLGNPTELKQVLLNLTINALEAVSPRTGQVIIEGSRDNTGVQLIVRDNGRGMTPDVLEHVFEPFFTAKRGAGEPGTGLGLSITHAIVEAHHGTIRAESAGPGQGSAFTITLPSAQSAEQAPRLHEDSPQNADAQNSRSPQNSVSQPSLKESA
jgi:two-component system, NtrC family, sensor kinase